MKNFFRLAGLLPLCASALVVAAIGNGATTPSSGAVVAEVDGQKITLGDLEQKKSQSFFQARNSYYQVERKALDDYIDQLLLEKQAQREHLTVDQLIDRHVKSQLPKDPSDEALEVYYEGLDTKESFEKMKPQIADHIREMRTEKAKSAYIQSLRKEANVMIALAPPRADVQVNDAPVKGSLNASVMVIEYADYECPYCQQVYPTLQKLESEYAGKVAFAYKDTPLPMHSHAEKAAEAAHCAGAQGKYWEYHDILFSSKELDIAALKQDAASLKLDTAAFNKCLDSGETAGSIKTTVDEAQKLGLQGTPSFFVNGRFLSGAVTYDALNAAIQEELAIAAGAPKERASR
ncbi:MAG: thioredoxin domain-containing protein [Acidobacteriaceae bacterium]|nr:thioredoxin domain-containing protein [Acidobacteriaceae bacterium]